MKAEELRIIATKEIEKEYDDLISCILFRCEEAAREGKFQASTKLICNSI